jgi:hypothetical protein
MWIKTCDESLWINANKVHKFFIRENGNTKSFALFADEDRVSQWMSWVSADSLGFKLNESLKSRDALFDVENFQANMYQTDSRREYIKHLEAQIEAMKETKQVETK